MKRNIILPALLLASAAAIAAPALADHHGQRGEGITRLDTNSDGAITRAEAEAPRLERFAAADANGDGALTQAEMEAYTEAQRQARMEERRAKRFARMDTDGNGTISSEEFVQSRGAKMFDRLDEDDDGVVSAAEIEAAEAKWSERRGRRGHRRGQPRAPRTEQ